MRTLTQRACRLAAVVLASLFAASAHAAYPDRPLRLIVPYSPGQGTDVVARLIAERLSPVIGQTVVVENRPGAGGNIGAAAVAGAPADGYTLLMGTNATNAANAAMYSKMTYDHERDFAPVILVGLLPMVFAASADFPASSVQDVLRMARDRPDAINVGLPSTTARIELQYLRQLTGVKLFPVSYQGSGQAYNDLFGGQVQLVIDTVPGAGPHIQSGRLKPLGISTRERSEVAPDIPTLHESGVEGFELSAWNAVFVPSNTPQPVVERLAASLREVLQDEALRQRLLQLGMEPAGGTPRALADFVAGETRKWGELVRQAGIKAN